jgi:hypothetical protein
VLHGAGHVVSLFWSRGLIDLLFPLPLTGLDLDVDDFC